MKKNKPVLKIFITLVIPFVMNLVGLSPLSTQGCFHDLVFATFIIIEFPIVWVFTGIFIYKAAKEKDKVQKLMVSVPFSFAITVGFFVASSLLIAFLNIVWPPSSCTM